MSSGGDGEIASVPTEVSREVMKDRLERMTRLQRRWSGWVDKVNGPLPARDVDTKTFQSVNREYEENRRRVEQQKAFDREMRIMKSTSILATTAHKAGEPIWDSSVTQAMRPTSAALLRGKTATIAAAGGSKRLQQQQRRPNSAQPAPRSSQFDAAAIARGAISSSPLPDSKRWYSGDDGSGVDTSQSRSEELTGVLRTLLDVLENLLIRGDAANLKERQTAADDSAGGDSASHQGQHQRGFFWHETVPRTFALFEGLVSALRHDTVMGPLMLLLFDVCKRAVFVDGPPFLSDNVSGSIVEAVASRSAEEWITERAAQLWGRSTTHYKAASVAVHPLLVAEMRSVDMQLATNRHTAAFGGRRGGAGTSGGGTHRGDVGGAAPQSAMETYGQRRKALRKHFIAWHRCMIQTRVNRASANRFAAAKEQATKATAFWVWRWAVSSDIRQRRHDDFINATKMLQREETRHGACQTELHQTRHSLHTTELQLEATRGELAAARRELRGMESPMVFDFRKPIMTHRGKKVLREGTVHFRLNNTTNSAGPAPPPAASSSAQHHAEQGYFDLTAVLAEEGVAMPGKENAEGHYVIRVDSGPLGAIGSSDGGGVSDAGDAVALQWVNRTVEAFCAQKLPARQSTAGQRQAIFGTAQLEADHFEHRQAMGTLVKEWTAAAQKLKVERRSNCVMLSAPPTPKYHIQQFGVLARRPDIYIALLAGAAGSVVNSHMPPSSSKRPFSWAEVMEFVSTMLEKLGCLQRVDIKNDGFEDAQHISVGASAATPQTSSLDASRSPGSPGLNGMMSTQEAQRQAALREALHRVVVSRLRSFALMQRALEKYGTVCATLHNGDTSDCGVLSNASFAIGLLQSDANALAASVGDESGSDASPAQVEATVGAGRATGVVRHVGKTLPSLVNQRSGTDHTVDTSCAEVLAWVRRVFAEGQQGQLQLQYAGSEDSTQSHHPTVAGVATTAATALRVSRRRSIAAASPQQQAKIRRMQQSNSFKAERFAKYVAISNLEEDFGSGLELFVLLFGELLGAQWVAPDPDGTTPRFGTTVTTTIATAGSAASAATPLASATVQASGSLASNGAESFLLASRGASSSLSVRSPLDHSISPREPATPHIVGSNAGITGVAAVGCSSIGGGGTVVRDWVSLCASSTLSPADEEMRRVAQTLCRVAAEDLKCHVPGIVVEQLHLLAPGVKLLFLTSVYNKIHNVAPAPKSAADGLNSSSTVAPLSIPFSNQLPIPTLSNARLHGMFGKAAGVEAVRAIIARNWAMLSSIFCHYATYSEVGGDNSLATASGVWGSSAAMLTTGASFAIRPGASSGGVGMASDVAPSWSLVSVAAFVADLLETIPAIVAMSSLTSGAAALSASTTPSPRYDVALASSAPFVRCFKGQALRAFLQVTAMTEAQVRDDTASWRSPASHDKWVWPADASTLDRFVEARLLALQTATRSTSPLNRVTSTLSGGRRDGHDDLRTVLSGIAAADSDDDRASATDSSENEDDGVASSPRALQQITSAPSFISNIADSSTLTSPKNAASRNAVQSLAKLRCDVSQFAEVVVRLAVLVDIKRWQERGFSLGNASSACLYPTDELEGGTGGSAALSRWYEGNHERVGNFFKSLSVRLQAQARLTDESTQAIGGPIVKATTSSAAQSPLHSDAKSLSLTALLSSASIAGEGERPLSPQMQRAGSPQKDRNKARAEAKGRTVLVPPPSLGSCGLGDARARVLTADVICVVRSEFWATKIIVPLFSQFSNQPKAGTPASALAGWRLLEQRAMSLTQFSDAMRAVGLDYIGTVDDRVDNRSGSASVGEFLRGFSAVIDVSSNWIGVKSPNGVSRLQLPGTAQVCQPPSDELLSRIFVTVALSRSTMSKLAAKAAGKDSSLVPGIKFNSHNHANLMTQTSNDSSGGTQLLSPSRTMASRNAAGATATALTVTYSGFVEALTMLAAVIVPLPWVPIKEKLQLLLQHMYCHFQPLK